MSEIGTDPYSASKESSKSSFLNARKRRREMLFRSGGTRISKWLLFKGKNKMSSKSSS